MKYFHFTILTSLFLYFIASAGAEEQVEQEQQSADQSYQDEFRAIGEVGDTYEGDQGGPDLTNQTNSSGGGFRDFTNTALGKGGESSPAVGSGEVDSKSGSYNYSLNLEVPPGINGLTPSVGIKYNSEGVNDGPLGAGFQISYLEDCISRRGPAAQNSDGNWTFRHGTPSFTSADVFYRNGSRLVQCDETQAASDSCPAGTYRAAVNDFVKIVKDPANVKFVAYHPDGTVMEYGRALPGDYAPNFDGRAKFCLSRVSKDGNSIEIGSTQTAMLEILYGGQSAANHKWKISYLAQSAREPRIDYSAGFPRYHSSLISAVEIRAVTGDLRIRKYALQYWLNGSVTPHLYEVREFGKDDSLSLNPYRFFWEEVGASGVTHPTLDPLNPFATHLKSHTNGLNEDNAASVYRDYSSTNGWPHYAYSQGVVFIDFNHDGLMDMVRHEKLQNARAWRQQADGSWVEDAAWALKFNAIPAFSSRGNYPDGSGRQYSFSEGVQFVDLNGDGFLDVTHASGAWFWNPALDGGAGNFEPVSGLTVPPGGYSYQVDTTPYSQPASPVASQTPRGMYFVDVNSDGLTDLVISDSTIANDVYLNNGHGFAPAPSGVFDIPPDVNGREQRFMEASVDAPDLVMIDRGMRFGDVNGDGLVDIVKNHLNCRTGPCTRDFGVWLNSGRGWVWDYEYSEALAGAEGAKVIFTASTRGAYIENCDPVWGCDANTYESNSITYGTYFMDIDGDGISDFTRSIRYESPDANLPVTNPHYCTSSNYCQPDGNGHTPSVGTDPADYSWHGFRFDLLQSGAVNLIEDNGLRIAYPFAFYSPRRSVNGYTLQSAVLADNGIQLTDLDGDGLVDALANRIIGNTQYGFVFKNAASPYRNRVVRVDSESGLLTNVSYALTNAAQHPGLPRRRVVVSQVNQGGYIDGGYGGSTRLVYTYSGGGLDEIENEFTGYERVSVTSWTSGIPNSIRQWMNDAVDYGRSKVSHYVLKTGENDWCHSRAPASVETYLINTSTGTQTFYESKTYSYNDCPSQRRAPAFSPPTQLVTGRVSTSAGQAVRTKETYSYDSYGNRTVTDKFLRDTDSDPVISEWQTFYNPGANQPWLPSRPCQRGAIAYENGFNKAVFGEYFYYDGNTTSICAISNKGQITRVDRSDLKITQYGMSRNWTAKRITYTPAGNIASTTDSRGGVTSTNWSSAFPEIYPGFQTNAKGFLTSYSYDSYGNRTAIVDPNNLRSETRFDALHRATHSWTQTSSGAQIHDTTFTYGYQCEPHFEGIYCAKAVESRARIDTSTYTYVKRVTDTFGNPARTTTCNNARNKCDSVSYFYDPSGNLLIETYPYSGSTYNPTKPRREFDFDAAGRVIRERAQADLAMTFVSYGGWTDPGGISYERETISAPPSQYGGYRQRHSLKDSWGRIAYVVECDGQCDQPSLGGAGQHFTAYKYDAVNNLVEINPAENRESGGVGRIYRFYDGFGRLIASKDPNTSNCADPTPSLYSSGCPLRYEYDNEGNLTKTADAKYALNPGSGTLTTNTYDMLNRLTSKTVNKGGVVNSYSYIFDTNSCGSSQFARGFLTKQSSSSGGGAEQHEFRYCYDLWGRLSRKMARISVPEGQFDNIYLYGGTYGAMQQPDDSGRDPAISADYVGELKGSKPSSYREGIEAIVIPIDDPPGGGGPQWGAFFYTYREDDQISQVIYPDGEVTSYLYDDLGRPVSIASSTAGSIVQGVVYESTHKPGQIILGNGSSMRFDYSSEYNPLRLDRIRWATGTDETLFLDEYLYNGANFVYSRYGFVGSLEWWDGFEYDYLDRLRTAASTSYQYSTSGNRVALTDFYTNLYLYSAFGSAYSGVAGPNAVRCTGGNSTDPCSNPLKTFNYDTNGNLTSQASYESGTTQTTYAYDSENRLKSIFTAGVLNSRYYYGPSASKVADLNQNVLTLYPDEDFQIEQGVPKQYYRLGSRIIAMRKGSALSYIGTDYLGSVRAVTDAAGSLSVGYNYDSFGGPDSQSGDGDERRGFTGMEKDSTGIYDFAARHYAPLLGSFLQPDTIIPNDYDPQSLNRYAYALNNPMKFVDPSGHKPEEPEGVETKPTPVPSPEAKVPNVPPAEADNTKVVVTLPEVVVNGERSPKEQAARVAADFALSLGVGGPPGAIVSTCYCLGCCVTGKSLVSDSLSTQDRVLYGVGAVTSALSFGTGVFSAPVNGARSSLTGARLLKHGRGAMIRQAAQRLKAAERANSSGLRQAVFKAHNLTKYPDMMMDVWGGMSAGAQINSAMEQYNIQPQSALPDDLVYRRGR